MALAPGGICRDDTASAAVRTTFLVISNDLRLRRVHKTMVGLGDRLQYSVFEWGFSAADLARCKHALGKLIHHREDQVLFVDLGPVDGRGDRVITSIGRAYSDLAASSSIVKRTRAPSSERSGRSSVSAPIEARPH